MPGPIWRDVENLAPTGIRSRAMQPVASRYTDCAIQTHWQMVHLKLSGWFKY
jgi:hypothetical protein